MSRCQAFTVAKGIRVTLNEAVKILRVTMGNAGELRCAEARGGNGGLHSFPEASTRPVGACRLRCLWRNFDPVTPVKCLRPLPSTGQELPTQFRATLARKRNFLGQRMCRDLRISNCPTRKLLNRQVLRLAPNVQKQNRVRLVLNGKACIAFPKLGRDSRAPRSEADTPLQVGREFSCECRWMALHVLGTSTRKPLKQQLYL